MKPLKPNVAALVEQMPDADRPGQESKFTGLHPKDAEKIFDEILQGGGESILGLIGLLRDATDPDFKNYKADYVLHCLAVYLGRPGKESLKREFSEVLASQIEAGKLSKGLQGFLIRELQVAGGSEVAGTLGKCLQDDELCQYAAQALIAIGGGAAAELRKAFPKAKGKNRVTIAQALGVVGDTKSADALRNALKEEDSAVRISAAWALANLGDAGAADAIMEVADSKEGWERIQATKACLLLAEKLQAAGDDRDSRRIYKHLQETRTDPADRYIRDVAEKALRV